MMNAVGYRQRLTAQGGMVLVIVLWIVTLLTVMAGGFAYSMRIETRLAASAVERAQTRALAEAGIAYALAWQLDPEAQKRWAPNGDPHDWAFGGGRLQIQVVDSSGLVNLNTASLELLKALLAAAGVDPRGQDDLAAAIQDWRNPDRQSMLHGAGSADYRAAGRFGPKNAPFESAEELQQVLGMTREVYARLADNVEAVSRHEGINPALAPARVLLAIGLDERTVTDYVTARAQDGAPGLALPPHLPNASFFTQSRTNIYHMTVTAEVETGTSTTVRAILTIPLAGRAYPLAGQSHPPAGQAYRLLSWREGS